MLRTESGRPAGVQPPFAVCVERLVRRCGYDVGRPERPAIAVPADERSHDVVNGLQFAAVVRIHLPHVVRFHRRRKAVDRHADAFPLVQVFALADLYAELIVVRRERVEHRFPRRLRFDKHGIVRGILSFPRFGQSIARIEIVEIIRRGIHRVPRRKGRLRTGIRRPARRKRRRGKRKRRRERDTDQFILFHKILLMIVLVAADPATKNGATPLRSEWDYSLEPVSISEPIISFWKHANRMSTGSTHSTDAAMTGPRSLSRTDPRMDIACGRFIQTEFRLIKM